VLLNMEGAEHAELRRKLGGLFTTRSVAALCADVAAVPMAAMYDDLTSRRPVDIVAVVKELAGAVICALVGLASADKQDLAKAFAAGTAMTSMVRLGRPRLTAPQIATCRAVMAELTAPAVRAYRAGDGSTVPGRMRDLGLTEDEALGAVAAFVLTGTETLVSYVPRLIALAADTGWLSRLASDPAQVDDVIGEGLRFTVPSPVMLRSVARDAKIGAVRVKAGERVVIATISCAKSLGPFDPDRPHPPELRQLWFGAGAHFCLGMPLAYAEIRTVLETVLAVHRSRPLSIVDRKVARNVLIPAYARLVLCG
jgi:cytochrome P450